MKNEAFRPLVGGTTVLVGTTPVQVNSPNAAINNEQTTGYRVRCLVAGYLAWAVSLPNNAQPTFATVTAPAANAPSTNTIGMAAGVIEVFQFPINAWFQSSVAAGFEITAGEGV